MTARLCFVLLESFVRFLFSSFRITIFLSQLLPLSDTTRTAHCCRCCCYFCVVLVSFHARVHDNGNPRWLAPTSARSIRQLMVAFISLGTEKHGGRVSFLERKFLSSSSSRIFSGNAFYTSGDARSFLVVFTRQRTATKSASEKDINKRRLGLGGLLLFLSQ